MTAKRIDPEIIHDDLVAIVNEELLFRGYKSHEIETHVDYKKASCGEIDLYMIRQDYVLLFEIKTNPTTSQIRKAKKQLDRAERCYFDNDKRRIFKLIAYYDSTKTDGWDCKWYRKKN